MKYKVGDIIFGHTNISDKLHLAEIVLINSIGIVSVCAIPLKGQHNGSTSGGAGRFWYRSTEIQHASTLLKILAGAKDEI